MKLITLAILAVGLVGCAAATDAPSDVPESATVLAADDAKADSNEPLYLRAAQMTIWAEPRVRSVEGTWFLSARSSYDIATVTATVADTEASVTRISSRKFEVALDARQLVATLEETPLLVDVVTTSGVRRTVTFTTRARFGESSGSSKLYPWRNLVPVIVAGDSVFRGRLTTRGEFERVDGFNDDDSEPIMSREDANHWLADFPSYALPWAASPTEDPVVFVAEDGDGRRYSRDVHIHMEIASLGITTEPLEDAHTPRSCDGEVRRCVDRLGAESDLEACGTTAEVRPCLDELPPDDTTALVEAFAGGLRHALIEYYGRYEEDIVRSGGNPRTSALRLVNTALVEEVHGPDDVPSGHDLETHRVFRHPDVVFPGSDVAWYGVFDRATGELLDVYDFN